jgi:glucosamine-6-phosphate deaminase
MAERGFRLTAESEMKLQICDTGNEAALAAAAIVVEQLRNKPASVLGLPTGQTALAIYDALVGLHRARRVDFSQAHTVNLDEFVGLCPTDPRSFRGFMQEHLFRHVDIPADHVHFLAGDARDTERECARFERLIASLGGIDLVLLGVGRNGHIGFNEPARNLHLRTHRARLRLDTRRANAGPFGGRVSAVPREALSLGMASILQATSIVLVALGSSKAPAVTSAFSGRISTDKPVSFLQLHPSVTVIVDRAAAAGLPSSLTRAHAESNLRRRASGSSRRRR